MAPRMRSDGRRRRRLREWAAPFVVTVALAPGCTKSSKEPTHTKNPPDPPPAAADAAVAKAPEPPPDPTPRRGVYVPPPGWTYLGDIRRDKDGCKLHADFECEPDTKCNPPAPEAVPCPVAWLQPGQDGPAVRKPDGTCEFQPPDGCPDVPPGQPIPPCNPPPPVAIPCPGEKPPK